MTTTLRELLGRATPGPWTFEPSQTDAGTRYQHIRAKWRGVANTYHSDPICFEGGTPLAGPGDIDENGDEWVSSRHGNAADAALIAAAVNALPALLDVVEAADELEHDQGCNATFAGFNGKCDCRIAKLLAALAALAAVEGGDV